MPQDIMGVRVAAEEIVAGDKLAGKIGMGRIDAGIYDGDVNNAGTGTDIPPLGCGYLRQVPLRRVERVVRRSRPFGEEVVLNELDERVSRQRIPDFHQGVGMDLDPPDFQLRYYFRLCRPCSREYFADPRLRNPRHHLEQKLIGHKSGTFGIGPRIFCLCCDKERQTTEKTDRTRNRSSF